MKQGLWIASSIAALAVAMPVQAQEAGGAEYSGEIVVTAQKRVQNVQDVPISISVVGGEDILQQGSASLVDYAGYVPGMNARRRTAERRADGRHLPRRCAGRIERDLQSRGGLHDRPDAL
jgi:outer membrane receptor protein involved in Fe transport